MKWYLKIAVWACIVCATTFVACDKKEDNPVTFTVSFDADGGSPVPAAQQVETGGTATAPANNPAKTGYVFLFWHLNGSSTAYNFSTPVIGNITLQAKWEEEAKVEYWQVSWVLNGGVWPSGDNHATQVVKEGALSEPIAPTKAGNTFDGWYKEPALANKINFPYDVSSVTGNFTLYAKWSDPAAEYWNITWELNGGAWPSTGDNHVAKIERGSSLNEPVAPVKEGSSFDGWYKEATFTNKVTFPATVTSDFKLYAKWNIADNSPYSKLNEGLYKVAGTSYEPIQLTVANPAEDNLVKEAVAWVNTNSKGTSASIAEYVLVLNSKTYNTPPNELTKPYTTLTVYGKPNANIQLTDPGSIFDIGDYNTKGIKFVLDGYLTLKGIDNNKTALLQVSFGTIAEMKGNSKITTNRNADDRSISGTTNAGGVYIYDATLIMDDNAEISDVTHVRYSYMAGALIQKISIAGGGVYITGSSDARSNLTMKGKSKITGCVVRNTASISGSFAQGGGIYLAGYSDLIMEDNALISGNVSRHDSGRASGGGVYASSNATITQRGSSKIENNIPDNVYK